MLFLVGKGTLKSDLTPHLTHLACLLFIYNKCGPLSTLCFFLVLKKYVGQALQAFGRMNPWLEVTADLLLPTSGLRHASAKSGNLRGVVVTPSGHLGYYACLLCHQSHNVVHPDLAQEGMWRQDTWCPLPVLWPHPLRSNAVLLSEDSTHILARGKNPSLPSSSSLH